MIKFSYLLRKIVRSYGLSSISCKKDTSSRSDIIGNWKLQNIKSELSTKLGIVDSLTIFPTNGDYLDFRDNGKCYSNNWIGLGFNSEHKIEYTTRHILDTSFYQVKIDKLISTKDNKSDTITIFQLTNKSLIIGFNIKIFNVDIPIDTSDYIIWNTKYNYIK